MPHVNVNELITFKDIPLDVLVKYCDERKISNEIRVYLEIILGQLESLIKNNDELTDEWIHNTFWRLEACVDRTWEALNTGYWKDVPIRERHCYTICSVMKCMLLEIDWNTNDNKIDENGKDKMEALVEQIDKGLLLGAPLDEAPDMLTKMATRFNKYFSDKIAGSSINILECENDKLSKELLPGFGWIKRYKCPSMETFYRDIFVKKVPAVLEDCMKHWKALELWKDPKYLINIAGIRTVPIEVGSRYTDEDWSQCLVTFADFIKSHMSKDSKTIGYLAQHQLFEQIPELKEDFSVPDYCTFFDEPGEIKMPDINAWFGPKGTISPNHFDPKNNLLCQVLGTKQIFLYPPEDAENLYPFEGMISNTGQADPLNPDYEKFPNFKKASGTMCYLGPGEMLFIPPGWWHHIVSLSPSFSISFWW
ncbi:hypothetical protein HCN44_003848 [Aphidius gifuensis]|uniref:JmjC domain-containing protein n=2 Tax=Aphidius gifuensis TaxID=684658 RepID=A0A834XX31_APHGI|nr:bifunctional peptidase and arginyl-hydroxylase JMJD5 isoform X2 [Aphidius gifuensis]XP_044001879.1 bifunctional peptidase and arginyl-hydroxylase JMJD5 isoform X2 [Aphidius gifuensis]KAF7994376.1 hypothetical protein HCN44_003848 [Aphidius gifuensis]